MKQEFDSVIYKTSFAVVKVLSFFFFFFFFQIYTSTVCLAR